MTVPSPTRGPARPGGTRRARLISLNDRPCGNGQACCGGVARNGSRDPAAAGARARAVADNG